MADGLREEMLIIVAENPKTVEAGIAGLHGKIKGIRGDVIDCLIMSGDHGFPLTEPGSTKSTRPLAAEDIIVDEA